MKVSNMMNTPNFTFDVSLFEELINNLSFTYLIIGVLLIIFIIGLISMGLTIKMKFTRRNFGFYKKEYPNAFAEFCRRAHIYPWKNCDEFKKREIEKILSHQLDEWKNVEKQEQERIEQERLVSTKYNEIKYKYPDGLNCWKQTYPNATEVEIVSHYSSIIILNEKCLTEKWGQEQCSFAELCHNQIITMPHCNDYQYSIDFPRNCNDEAINAQYDIGQFCFFEFCSEEDLDYTYFQQFKDNYEYIKDGYYYANYDCANWCAGIEGYISEEIRSFVKSLNIPVEIILTEDNLGENPQMFILHFDLNKAGYKTMRWGDIDNINSKYIVIIDTVTTNEQLKKNCELICQKYKKLRPCITYISLLKELSREEMQNLIDSKKIESGEQKCRDELQDFTTDTYYENIVNSTGLDFKNHNTKDVSNDLEILKVDYPIPIQFLQESEDWEYAVAKFPKEGNVVFPYRRHSVARKGYMDLDFHSYLQWVLGNQLLVISDCSILPAENYRPYEPDIAIIDLKKPSICIDVEIDEPYSAISNQPIHFIGCGDDFRDANLNNLGWIVVRFTEYQVVSNMRGCAAFIAQILNAINPNFTICTSLLPYSLPVPVKRWSDIEAKVMASEKIRERYLNHEFSIKETEQITLFDIKQDSIEKKYATLIKPLVVNEGKSSGIVNFQYQRDDDIQFLPLEHIYLYKGKERLIPANSIISYFFTEFDAFHHSARIARRRGVSQGQVLEEWDERNTRSKEIGKFVHKQIANNYNGLKYQNKYHFQYAGKYVKTDEYIDLQREYEQFRLFLNSHIFAPFKTEWNIYDENLKIAGTIDMIHKKDTLYDIYDWKYSHRIVDSTGKPILINSYENKGIRGLENVQDTEFCKACLRQNLYKYILEKNYDIRIDKMYLVVFTDNLPNYLKFEVPRMDNEIKNIWNFCEKGNVVQLF